PVLGHALRQAQGQQIEFRHRPLGRKVGEIHPQRLLRHHIGWIVSEEIGAFRDLVGGDDKVEAGPRRDGGGVVLPPERARRAGEGREDLGDDVEFVHRRRHQKPSSSSGTGSPNSGARFLCAMRSRAALTKPGSSPAKKSWAMPTYSSITTLAGMSL